MMFKRFIFVIIGLLIVSQVFGRDYIHHQLNIALNPSDQSIEVMDTIQLPGNTQGSMLYFILHGELEVSVKTDGLDLAIVDEEPRAEFFGVPEERFSMPEGIPYKLYKITSKDGVNLPGQFNLAYQGSINHPVEQISKEYARGFSETPGIISEQGVYLAGSSYWLPWLNRQLVTFDMTVTAKPQWKVVSQGKRSDEQASDQRYQVTWQSPEPMDEVFLIAAPFTEYLKKVGKVNVIAYLRTPDQSLANKYLETTGQYLEMYRQLIGPYPYTKFALIENFWETGYGMPSFTLLGEKVIRFPFILHSSYPHELLHNWWGNSVFVDYESGNWCEGLTVYLADHLIKEQRGQGAEYRRTSLQAYTDYVNEDNEVALTEFRSRYDAASSAIGYNKSMMIFNMLRQQVGDDLFVRALQTFYRDNIFKRATFQDIRKSFETVAGKTFTDFFKQWVEQPGAPVLEITETKVAQKDGSYSLSFTLSQNQQGAVYQLQVPVAVYLAGDAEAKIEMVALDKKEADFEFIYQKQPLRIDIDPQFDVFRRLDRNEIPPALSQVFGADKVTIILPADENPEKFKAYQTLADNWSKSETDKMQIVVDDELDNLPADQAVWLFGENNKFRSQMTGSLSDYDVSVEQNTYRIGKSVSSAADNSIILCARHPVNPDLVITWLQADNAAALPGLGRKLPHYGKYSYLAFEGEEPTNILKGQWPAVNSPLSTVLDHKKIDAENSEKVRLPQRQALAMLAPLFSEEQMLAHVNFLAAEDLQGRGLGTAGLDKAADYIAAEFKKAGLTPGADDGTFFQTWQESDGPEGKEIQLRNVIGYIPGNKQEWKDQSVVICAHYDHLGLGWPDVRQGNEGKIHFGADDNASGVAVLIELAKLLSSSMVPDRSIVFIAVSGEESGLRGSRYFVKNYKKFPAQNIIGAINLDTIGRLNDQKILILSSSSASEWKHIAMGIGFVTGIPYELVAQDLDASDQVSFIEAGIPAIQLFSGPHNDYHRPSDTVDKVDAEGMVKIASFTREAVAYLAERENPMTFTGRAQSAQTPAGPPSGGRKVGTGVMPDFAFQGQGVRAGSVAPNSPAARAGIQAGDVIIRLGDEIISDLRGYSNAMKNYQPGDKTTIIYTRDGKEFKSEIILQAR